MSLKICEKVLLEFLENPEPQVVALKGSWGSGKTYFWDEFLKKHKHNNDLGFKKYSYCSLFGINSINDLKYSILENSIPKSKLGEEINWSDSKISWITKKGSQLFRSSPLNQYSGMGLLFINTKEQSLICLDDLERMTNDEQVLNNVLGLISELKKNRKCKIIIIYNEDELGEKENYYKKFKEKIIDIEIEFLPTPEECSQKAFKNYKDPTNIDSVLYTWAVKLEITNIRILNKIKKVVEIIEPYTKGLNSSIFQQTISSATILTYCYLGNPDNLQSSHIPSIDFLLSYEPFASYLKKERGVKIELNEEEWGKAISEFGWTNTDDFDNELLNTIKRGYVIDDCFLKVAKNKSESYDAGDIDKKYSEIWRNQYHGGFRDNKDEFINAFLNLFKDASKFLSVSQLNDVVCIFKELGNGKDANLVIEYYIEANKDKEEKIKIEGSYGFYLNQPLDEDIKKGLIEAYKELKKIPNIKELLDMLIDKDYPSSEDESILFLATEDEIYNIFDGLIGVKFDQYRSILYKYKNVSNASKEWKELIERTTQALKRFGTNEINKRRLKSYGIE